MHFYEFETALLVGTFVVVAFLLLRWRRQWKSERMKNLD